MATSSKACLIKICRVLLAVGIVFWAGAGVAGKVYMASVNHQNGVYFIEVDVLVNVPEPQARKLLTDYNNLARVNPAIEVSKIIKTREPGDYRVRTETEACVWFYCMRVHQVQDVVEAHGGSVTATIIPQLSDFRKGYARLNLWQESGGTRILIRSEVEPDFWIPPIIGPWLIKRKLRSETLETVANIERVAQQEVLLHNTASEAQ